MTLATLQLYVDRGWLTAGQARAVEAFAADVAYLDAMDAPRSRRLAFNGHPAAGFSWSVKDIRRRVEKATERLGDPLWDAIKWVVIDGYSPAEAAVDLGYGSQDIVLSLLVAAGRKLQSQYEMTELAA